MDLGAPISYMVLDAGTAVFTADGERIGVVEHVLADANSDVFDGIVIDTRPGPGGWRFVDASHVAAIHERGVRLAVAREDAERLPQPSANPAAMSARPDATEPDDLSDKLRRAWDRLSGRG